MTERERIAALEHEFASLASAARAVVESAEPGPAADRAVVDAVAVVRMRRQLDAEPAPSAFHFSIT